MPVRHRWQIILAAQGLCVSCKLKQTFRIKKSSVYREPSSRKVQCGALDGRSRSTTDRRSFAENLRDEFDAKPEVLPRDFYSMSKNSLHQCLAIVFETVNGTYIRTEYSFLYYWEIKNMH